MPSLEEFLGAPVTERPWPERVKHLSASSLGMASRCGEQFRQRYILGNKERPGEAIVVGSIFHEALEHNYVPKVESHEDLPLSEVVQFLQDEAVPKVIEAEGGMDAIRWDTSLDTARADSERMMTSYYKEVVPRVQPLAVEERFEVEIPGLPVPLIGYTDVRETARLIDTKTGKQSASKMKPSWQLQSRIYSLATGLPVEYHSVSRARVPKIVTGLESPDMIGAVPSDRQVAALISTLNAGAGLISYYWERFGPDEEWPTTGSIADWSRSLAPCMMCGWRKGCSAWAE